MEDLTKTQLVLLTLLVSFVTSIGTGIITTSLLAEAPAGVTQTINRVVERTIEKVVPAPTNPLPPKEVTVVVKEEDAIINTIDKLTKSVVSIKVRSANGTENFYGLGTIVSKDGLVVSDGESFVIDGSYSATLHDGTVLSMELTSRNTGLAFFKIAQTSTQREFVAVPFSSTPLKLGQSVIAVQGRDATSVAVGRVTALGSLSVTTDLASRGELPGGPIANLSGELVGIKASSPDLSLPPGIYVTGETIKKSLSQATP